jgi:aspartyl-tRNA(Asn)/glutamyl-tRNA(Gln) amidotransferase subunit B
MKRIGITRIHMEEDAGKSIHDFGAETLVDLNRAGVPLIEIVSEPDMRSSAEAVEYVKTIRSILMYLGICDGNMEEGSLRCDVNVSARLKGTNDMNARAEIKNLNSFKTIAASINSVFEQKVKEFELNRASTIFPSSLESNPTSWMNFPSGYTEPEVSKEQFSSQINPIFSQVTPGPTGPLYASSPIQSVGATGSFVSGVFKVTRTKEAAHDYRYFPEPDLLPVLVSEEYKAAVKKEIPPLPREVRNRFINDYKLPKYDADVLTAEKTVADFFEASVEALESKTDESIKSISNFIMGEVMRMMSERKENILQLKLQPQHLSELVGLIQNKTISNKIAKDIFPDLPGSVESPKQIVERRGLVQVTDSGALHKVILEVIAANPDNVAKYKAGKTALFGYFVGQTMKATGGKANPELINDLIKQELEKQA